MTGRAQALTRADIDVVFDERAIASLAARAKIPANADFACFTNGVRIAASEFLKTNLKLSPAMLRRAIAELYSQSLRAEHGNDRAIRSLARSLELIHPCVREWICRVNYPDRRSIPARYEILSPETRFTALITLRQQLTAGGKIVEGRRRANGKRSRSFMPLLKAPEDIPPNRPPHLATRELIRLLAFAYCEGTGKLPPRVFSSKVAHFGPFGRLVEETFRRLHLPTGYLPALLNEYGAALYRRSRTSVSPL